MVTKKNNKNLEYYRGLPWTYNVTEGIDNSGKKIYIVSVNELPGVKTDAYNRNDAFEEIKEAMDAAFELYLEMGDKIPEPKKTNEYKGNITYRTTSEQHALIAAEAKRRKKPINKLLDEFVTNGLYAKSAKRK